MINEDKINLFNGFALDLARGCVTLGGEPVHLRPQSYEVLKYLVENKGHLISKDRLIEEVWKGRAVTDGSLVKCIEEVREALGPDAPHHVRNVRGRGYIFDAGIYEPDQRVTTLATEQIDFVRVTVEDHEEIPTPAPLLPAIASAPRSQLSLRKAALVALALLVVGVTVLGIYWFFSKRQTKASALVAVPFRDMDISRLTNSGKSKHAAISPDGKYIAHVTKNAEGDSLWVRQVGAPNDVRISGPAESEYLWVAFAPDGNSIYYITLDRDKGDTGLYRVPVLGGPSTMAGYDLWPVCFSPDRKEIAFIRMNRSESYLIIANDDSTNQRILARRQHPDFFRGEWNAPAWSPDGKTIACPVRLTDEHGEFETIFGIDVKDGSQTPLTSKRWSSVDQPQWLADGTGVLLTARERSTDPRQVWHIAVKSGEATRVTHDLNDYHDLSLTHDSSRLTVVQDQAVSNIWVAREGAAVTARQIVSEIGPIDLLAWTPDGRIVYRSNAGESSEIWIADAGGAARKQLTADARVSGGLTVSPNGRYIFFVSDHAGHFNIWRVDADGQNLKQITKGDGEFFPECSPDGEWVVYQQGYYEPRLWKMRTDGGSPVQLTVTRANRPAVSADGQIIAYHYLDPEIEKSQWSIGIVSSDGGQRLLRFNLPPTVELSGKFVRWFPDNKSIAYVNNAGGLSEIWLQPLDGGPPKQLTGFKAEQILAFDWSRDGRSLAFVRNVETSDVVLIVRGQK